MSSAIDRILGRSLGIEAEPTEYHSFVDSGGRPQMGFYIAQANGTIDGFLYHNLDNLRLQTRNGSDFLSFTHRGTAVTIQGARLRILFKAIMRHTLMEIHEPVEAEIRNDQPIIIRLAITFPDDIKHSIKSAASQRKI